MNNILPSFLGGTMGKTCIKCNFIGNEEQFIRNICYLIDKELLYER